MRINKLELTNFRGIEKLLLDLNGENTVLYGLNGSGKSSLLRAITIGLSKPIQKSIKSKYKLNKNIELSDIRFGKSETKIELDIEFDENEESKEFKYFRKMTRKDKHRTEKKGIVDEFGDYFIENFIECETCGMPIFLSYGVHRVVLDIPLRIRKNHDFNKTSAFEKAIESTIDFRTFFEWFRNQEDYENQLKVSEGIEYTDVSLECVRSCVYKVLDGFSDLKVDRNPLRMVVHKNGMKLELNQLSDGEKCTLALIGDLARRLALANYNLENPLDGHGIVLIDEIELHMHPQWQRKILNVLSNLFPNIQFIITTHSPQVLGEIETGTNIYRFDFIDGQLNYSKLSNLMGWDSNYILEEFMNTSSLNQSIKNDISKMYSYIKDGKLDNAEAIMNKLQELTDPAQEDVVKAQILISRKKRKQ